MMKAVGFYYYYVMNLEMSGMYIEPGCDLSMCQCHLL